MRGMAQESCLQEATDPLVDRIVTLESDGMLVVTTRAGAERKQD
jgi:hypothetical protein